MALDLYSKKGLRIRFYDFEFPLVPAPKRTLQAWRQEVGRSISMRRYRRLRGRVKAGRAIPDVPEVVIVFDRPTGRVLAPFVRPIR